MKAVVLDKPCRAEELAVREVPKPKVKPGWVLVKIKAFGINRSEIFTRQGDSPAVKLPRIIGIECVGEIEDPSDSSLRSSLKLLSEQGILCMIGILGGEWVLNNFEPMTDIISGTYFTQFDSQNIKEEIIAKLFNHIEKYKIKVPIAEVFSLDEINKAHLLMESNLANGKIVITN